MTRSMTRWMLAGRMALAALGAVTVFEVAPATAAAVGSVVSTVSDPVGDALFNAPTFQDIVSVQMTRTASGDFDLLMEMAGPVPAAPPMPLPASHQIWWVWNLDLDPTTSPRGYPLPAGSAIVPEFMVLVSWDGTAFAGTAIDRRPLLSGGEAIITPVPFSIDGTGVEADLASTLIGEVPSSFACYLRTIDWSGPVGSGGYHIADGADLAP
jgi:hypothetical protein